MGFSQLLFVLLLLFTSVAAEGRVPTAPVRQDRGYSPIPAHVATPNRIVSRDEATGEVGYKRVLKTFRATTDRVVYVRIAKAAATQRGRSERLRVGEASAGGDGEDADSDPPTDAQILRCSPPHPFWVTGRGWVTAEHLRVGDSLVSDSGEALVVVGHEIKAEHAEVFNFHVAEWNTYFVAEDEAAPFVWVHNKGVSDRLVGRLDGEVISRDYYRKLQNYLNKRGVDLRRGNESAFNGEHPSKVGAHAA